MLGVSPREDAPVGWWQEAGGWPGCGASASSPWRGRCPEGPARRGPDRYECPLAAQGIGLWLRLLPERDSSPWG